jgi:hypothetical protein
MINVASLPFRPDQKLETPLSLASSVAMISSPNTGCPNPTAQRRGRNGAITVAEKKFYDLILHDD